MSGPRTAWSTPADIVAGVQRLWDSGALLATRLDNAPLFPYELRLRQPGVTVMGEQFEQVRSWGAMLKAGSRAEQGHGYDLTWRDINHRQLGRNSIPFAAVIDTEAEALRMIGRARDARQFDTLAAHTLASFPQLHAWVRSHPRKLLYRRSIGCVTAISHIGATSIPTGSQSLSACVRPCQRRVPC